ncbi:hypothetical protein BV22DRAFT_1029912 [Leucogyrophana mollusca]|uniref:Uncharacterized protein n=1 Tax=Leucogyrophana mollusca TaxID=85980 RepID=A0ACB8BTQ4_9AGAM|nr:hypothetical protein BV22DRAFT_1029912 [Leucogyrophana mollusca]
MNTADIRDRIPRFRILVIGRANAGKTTILQKVCKTTENPEIYDGAEHKIDAAILESSKERGNHQIENEMVFPSNPGFVFHDSCGFEAGGEDEFEIAKRFISERADERRLEKRLHAIWYCIPMDEHSRAFTEAEAKFFDNCNPGSVPVIMVFTKFDALHNVAFSRVPRALPRQERLRQVSQLAESLFAETKIVDRLLARKYPPRCHVCLQDLHKLSADCNVLLESTAATLDDEVLKQLLVSTQQTNLELCIKYAVDDTLMKSVDRTHHPWTKLNPVELGEQLAVWFPQYTVRPLNSSMESEGNFYG